MFITGVNDTGEQLSPVTTTTVNNQFIAGDKNKVAMEVGAAKFIGDVINTGKTVYCRCC
jgi:hypothetical protein